MTTQTLPRARSRDVDLARRLIEDAGGTAAITAYASALEGSEALLLSGSLVDGLGNARSDLDLYLMAGETTGPSVQMALTEHSYIDVERIGSARLRDLGTRVEQEPDDSWVAATALGDLDLYYRLAIAVPVLADRPLPAEVAGLDPALLCRVLGHWADLHGTANAARARLARYAGRPRHAACYAHEAVVLMATSVLARLGDGYPSAKWVDEKARRTLGRASSAYGELDRLLTFDQKADRWLVEALEWVGRHSTRPDTALETRAIDGASVILGGPTGAAVVVGRSRYHAVLADDVAAVRRLTGRPEPSDEAALSALSLRERDALLVAVAADLHAAGAASTRGRAS